MIGKLYGVAETAALAVLERLGVTSGGSSLLGTAATKNVGTSAGNVVQLNGSAQLPAVDGSLLTGIGGASVEAYTEVATLAALQGALANGARLLVTADIAMGTTDTIDLTSITDITIAIKDGKTVSHSGTTDVFSASSGTCRLTLETGPRSGVSPAFVVTGSGKIADSSGVLVIDWSRRLHIDGPTGAWTPFGTGVKIDGGDLTIDAGNGLITLGYGYGKIRSLLANGGGASCAILLRMGCGPVTYRGQFRSYSEPASGSYALSVQNPFNPSLSAVGPVQFDTTGQTYTPCVYALGLVEVHGVHGVDNSYVPRVAPSDMAVCRRSRIVPVFVNTTNHGSFTDCYLQGATFETSAKAAGFSSCDFASATTTTFPTGSKPRIIGGRVFGTVVFQSGSEPVFHGGSVAGTVTIDSGANGRFAGLQDGGGTFSNNDPLSAVTLGENPLWDTTPSTRRYGDATLDALLDNHVAYWSGKASPCPNKAPIAACNAGGAMTSITGAVASTGSAFDLVDPTDQMIAPLNSWSPGAGNFSLRLNLDLDVASASEENIIDIGGGGNLALNLLSTGALRLYVGGVNVLDTSSNSITTGGGDQRITVDRTNGTITIRVNGVSRGTVANSTALAAADFVILGANGANAIDGKVSKITILDMGIPDATEQLWDTYSLAGAGA